ncbi:hypothetical protein CBS101457_005001 [Exobasidium rhododendri]|nr:hypothetical protein CBS101457_005001 [Exobasidium rhododendri]
MRGVKWTNNPATLDRDASKDGNIERFDYIRVEKSSTAYTYTIRAGAGQAQGSTLFVEAERTYGKGTGQQFKVNFERLDSSILKSYWITANVRCTIASPFPAYLLGRITVQARA